ncbi:MAG: hypothetical protein ABIS92_08400 [Polyangia bacterium]
MSFSSTLSVMGQNMRRRRPDMTTMAAHSADRPGCPSFLTVLPLALRSISWTSSRPMMAPISILASLMVMTIAARPVIPLSAMFTLALPLLAWLAWGLENTSVNALAFLKTLPIAFSPKSLVLAPLCTVAMLVVAVTRLALPFGIADAALVLALSWWAFVAGRWLAPRRPWLAALALPLGCWLPMVPAAFAQQRGGDWAAAGICAIFAMGGLLISPRDQTDRLLTGWSRRRHGRSLPSTASIAVIGSNFRARSANFFTTAWRVWMLTTPRRFRYLLIVIVVTGLVAELASFPLVSAAYMQVPMLLGFTVAPSKGTVAFLTTRPLSRLHLVTATLVPAGLLVMALQLSWLAAVRPAFFIGPEATAIFSHGVRPAETLHFLRQTVGATFLPTRLPSAGLPAESWPGLRALLQQHVVRVALLCIALAYSIAGTSLGWSFRTEWGWRPWGWRVLLVPCTLAGVLPCLPRIGNWRFPWPPAPLWLAACLALAAVISAVAHHFGPPGRHGR